MLSKKEAIASGHFQHYISKAEDTGVAEAIQHNSREFRKLLKKIPRKKRNYAYAEGKWTVKELLQHIIDAERVFVYRSLTFARGDQGPLPGFDENNWGANANRIDRKWNDLVEEFKAVRAATELFFESLGNEELQRTGTSGSNTINVIGLGYVVAGHAKHHIDLIKERYLA
jgi:uncharacterized damage-inducible protein DinB